MKNLLKEFYGNIPFKQYIFRLLKFIWNPKESIYKHLHFIGVIKVAVSKYKSFKIKHYGFQIENEIFWKGLNGGWEKTSVNIWTKLCNNAEVIFDIGANTGVYALIAKTVSPNSKVYAFEPVQRVYDKLCKNISLNNFDILAIDKAVSNADGHASIYDTNAAHVYSVTVNKNMTTHLDTIPVIIETITLNSIIKRDNIKKIDLIKIDVETHEPEVLEGFSDYLAAFRPSLLIEILTDEVADRVQNSLTGLNYLYFNIDENGHIEQMNKIICNTNNYNYLVCDKNKATELELI